MKREGESETPYSELTHRGRVLRMRRLAEEALAACGLAAARPRFLRWAGNTLFRVYAPATSDDGGGLFEPGQYLLRIHEPGYQQPAALELELAWLAAMRREADLPVPEPVAAVDGRLLISVSHPSVPDARHCSLLRWVKGSLLAHRYTPHHLRAQGRLMARMHDFAARCSTAQWQLSPGLTKRRFDWAGLFENDVGSGMPNGEAWSLLAPGYREAFTTVAEQVRKVMDAWGQGPEVYGLIHGDLGVDANLLFRQGEPRAIDFDDSGFGYWAYDLGVALETCWYRQDYPRYRDALLEGYVEVRALPQEQAAQVELFTAACEVYWNLWAVGGTHLYPEFLPVYAERMARTSEAVVRYVEYAR